MTYDLKYHGDQAVADGLVDLAVNVRDSATPPWLREALQAALVTVACYPDVGTAVEAVARRHGRRRDEVLVTSGAAEAFVLIARALRPVRAVVIHPQFTEPEAAMRAAGHDVERVVLPAPFELDATLVPDEADLVFVGNPTNPTSVLHPRSVLENLRRPGRIVVVDEAFIDCIAGESESFAGETSLDGVIVLRSLTKTWGLAGIRCGYLLAAAPVVRQLAEAQPMWSVNSLAIAACVAGTSRQAQDEVDAWVGQLAADRDFLLEKLADLAAEGVGGVMGVGGVEVQADPAASFVLLRVAGGDERVVKALAVEGFAVRRADTFPGLDASYIRVAVRDRQTSAAFVTALGRCIAKDVG